MVNKLRKTLTFSDTIWIGYLWNGTETEVLWANKERNFEKKNERLGR